MQTEWLTSALEAARQTPCRKMRSRFRIEKSGSKVCVGCHREKPRSEFYLHKTCRGGYDSRCKSCKSLYAKEHNRALGERGRARKRAIRASDPERHREYQRRYTERHLEQIRRSQEAYREQYPEHVKATRTNFKARSKGANGSLSPADWKAILLFYGRACGLCGAKESERPLTIDHYVPIRNGGSNDWRNVWPLCLPCNLKKGTTLLAEPAPPHVAVFEETHHPSSSQAEAQWRPA